MAPSQVPFDMTEQPIRFADKARRGQLYPSDDAGELDNAFSIKAESFKDSSFERIPNAVIDSFAITPDYRQFSSLMHAERKRRPAALRDILALPCDLTHVDRSRWPQAGPLLAGQQRLRHSRPALRSGERQPQPV